MQKNQPIWTGLSSEPTPVDLISFFAHSHHVSTVTVLPPSVFDVGFLPKIGPLHISSLSNAVCQPLSTPASTSTRATRGARLLHTHFTLLIMPLRNIAYRRDSSSSSECSDGSEYSHSTAPTVYSTRPSFKHHLTVIPTFPIDGKWNDSFYDASDPHSSVETYASTVASEDDFIDEGFPVHEEPEYTYESSLPTAVPSTPPEFAEFFPSTRRMCIRHDDTIDGNMNLRVDTERPASHGNKVDLTLFHLRMHDLKNREFSLRRYCRESGREVCHTSRKYTKPSSEKRPGLQRSMSNALASLRSKSETITSTTSNLKRQDSGYDSMEDDEEVDFGKPTPREPKSKSLPIPTNTTKLEFSNYAHLDLKRRGTKSSKRYEFEYWGTSYAWKRILKKNGSTKEISYHLYNQQTSLPVAHIVPTPMTPTEAHEEDQKGGWIPPCSMWISDDKILRGLSDVAE